MTSIFSFASCPNRPEVRQNLLIVCTVISLCFALNDTSAQQTFRPADPIASIDGTPVFLGELNLLLIEKFRASDLERVDMNIQRASSALLIQRHLALRSLREQGGSALQTILDREWQSFVGELDRRGSSVEDYAKRRKSDEKSVRATRDWESAWKTYLKSRMTAENLKRYYQANQEKYSEGRREVAHLFLATDKDVAGSEQIAEETMSQIVKELNEVAGTPAQLAERFAELTRRESDGATAKEGGYIGWVSKPGDLPRELMQAIETTQEGGVTSPIKTNRGYHLLLVKKVASVQTPYEALTDLTRLRRDAANALFAALVEKQSQARVTWFIKQLEPPKQN